MKRKNSIAEAASRNPSVVLRAFAADTELVCSLDAWILLEAIGSPFTTAGHPGLGDLVIAALVMADPDAALAARRAGKFDDLVRKATAGKRPADVLALSDKIAAAITAAFDPSDSGADVEKKSSQAPAGS